LPPVVSLAPQAELEHSLVAVVAVAQPASLVVAVVAGAQPASLVVVAADTSVLIVVVPVD